MRCIEQRHLVCEVCCQPFVLEYSYWTDRQRTMARSVVRSDWATCPEILCGHRNPVLLPFQARGLKSKAIHGVTAWTDGVHPNTLRRLWLSAAPAPTGEPRWTLAPLPAAEAPRSRVDGPPKPPRPAGAELQLEVRPDQVVARYNIRLAGNDELRERLERLRSAPGFGVPGEVPGTDVARAARPAEPRTPAPVEAWLL